MLNDQFDRKAAIDTLSAASAATLEGLWKQLGIVPEYRLVRGPETRRVVGGQGNPPPAGLDDEPAASEAAG